MQDQNILQVARKSKSLLKKIFDEVKKAIPDGTNLKTVEIWFQDEARVGQQGTITRLWAEKGTRPRALRQLQYEYAYIFGAVCPERDFGVALVAPEIGTDAMLAFLQEVSQSVPEEKIAVIVLDRAAWHTTSKLNIFPNLFFLKLPPASPELNSIEQLWEQLRDNSLANRCYENYEEIEDACCDAWMSYTNREGAIASLCTREWAKMDNYNFAS